MINYPDRIEDHHIRDKFREVIDALNASQLMTANHSVALAALTPPLTLAQIQKALQLGGTNPINITGLQGTLANPQVSASVGTHAQRLTTTPVVGGVWVETDRNSVYVGQLSGAAIVWKWVGGMMITVSGSLPGDLGGNDAGFLALETDVLTQYT